MSSPNDVPLSRRAARLAHDAEQQLGEGIAQPPAGLTRADVRGTSAAPSSVPTDMTYRTRVRPRVPYYDEPAMPSSGPRPDTTQPVTPTSTQPASATPSIAPAAYGGQQVRRRDFRPPTVEEAPAPPPATVSAAHGVDAPLDYHTRRAPGPSPAPEHTLTRRELRELREAQQVAAPADQPVAPVVMPAALLAYSEPPRAEPVTSSHSAPVVAQPPPSAEVAPVSPLIASPPTGSHWSVGIHSEDDPFENTFSREVGAAPALSTNALVLPEMPTGSIAGPVAGTGEIIVTGLIDVSHVVSATGAVPTLHDGSDIDDLFEPGDREIAAPDSAPVSALKAVSTHTAAHTVMTGKRSVSNTVTTVLVATTVVMAAVAIGLFVVAAMNGLF